MIHLIFSWRRLGGLLLLLSFCSNSRAASVTLAWDAESGVAGYVIYYGTTSGNYSSEVVADTNALATINNLQPGQTYYFAITSFDANGVQSQISPEISYLVPGLIQLTLGANPGGPMVLSFPESPGDFYEVQSSPDLLIWTTFWVTAPAVNNDWVQIPLLNTAGLPRQFFRLIMH